MATVQPEPQPQLVVLAGPNGAGKSTFYDAFLAGSPLPFLNADTFAKQTGLDSFEAARVLDATRARRIADGQGFITETVFSDPFGAKLDMLKQAVDAGFAVTLVYIGLTDAALSERRIDQRVATGGHDVPRDRVASRYDRSLLNLAKAIAIVPQVKLYDNSSADEPFELVATVEHGAFKKRIKGAFPAWVKQIAKPPDSLQPPPPPPPIPFPKPSSAPAKRPRAR
jgi:predicted ABC-type ATPase